MQPLRVAAALEHAAGELVDDLDLAVLDHVGDVALVQLLGAERVVEVMHEHRVDVVVEVVEPRISSTFATPFSVTATWNFDSSTS